ncbi:hypothetical protein F441_07180 [Phytophthora nicotianae CJ01A1]|uniref:Uncharacterized protein n=1 Tax=Phytophthora nicotianae CJ01A1 TaxID=1317063 RepID=W2X9M3_PHYNI|nr:hypothetical protein F441_07180 [Phytophthora nicotianae CJ01A1]
MTESEENFTLTSVIVVCRHGFGSRVIPHIVHLIQMFTENISEQALVDVLEERKSHLFTRVLNAVDESLNLVHHEKLRQYRYAMQLIPRAMTSDEGGLDAMQQLYDRYPGALDYEAVSCIIDVAELPMLKWLCKCKPLLFKQSPDSADNIFSSASLKGRGDVVRWVVKLFPDTVRNLRYAAQGGHLKLLKWLVKHTKWDEKSLGRSLQSAIEGNHLDTAIFIYNLKPEKIMDKPYLTLESIELMQWVHDTKCWDFADYLVFYAARKGKLEILQWLHANYPEFFSNNVMNTAVEHGKLEIVKFLHTIPQTVCTSSDMDLAAKNGYLDIVQWLHDHSTEGCTIHAMDEAARHGHLDVLQWLQANRSEGCTPQAMENADRHGRVYCVRWLHENFELALPKHFANTLASSGVLKLVSWLHLSGKGSWSKDTMDTAAANGHLGIVRFLHEKRREGCTKKAMDTAAENNHLEVVKFLHGNRREGCTKAAMNGASRNGHFEMVKWLQENRREGCTRAAMTTAAAGGHLKIMKFLNASYKLDWRNKAIENAVSHGHTEAVKWLYYHLEQKLLSSFAIRAARCDYIGILEFINTVSDFSSNTSVYHVGLGNKNPEVVKWYVDHYGNPRKRKY